jgi:hypothetical protein
MATPAIQAQNISPDMQVICLGNGGMKTITFAADGTAQETQTAHGPPCLQCAALQALPPTSQASIGLQATSTEKPFPTLALGQYAFEFRYPPARAPPTSKN